MNSESWFGRIERLTFWVAAQARTCADPHRPLISPAPVAVWTSSRRRWKQVRGMKAHCCHWNGWKAEVLPRRRRQRHHQSLSLGGSMVVGLTPLCGRLDSPNRQTMTRTHTCVLTAIFSCTKRTMNILNIPQGIVVPYELYQLYDWGKFLELYETL